jgi:hypothetical protein
LSGFTDKEFHWERLAITPQDFADNHLLGFPVKRKSNKGGKLAPGSWQPYVAEHGDRCVEVDAISPDEIRERVREAIESHIDQHEWKALQNIERRERETLKETLLIA